MKDKLYIPAMISSLLSSVVTVLFIFQMVVICTGRTIPTEKVNGFCLVFMLLCAFMNIIIAFSEGNGLLAIFLPTAMFVGLAIASLFASWQTSMIFLIIMTIASAVFTVVNIYNLNEYLRY